MYHLTETSSISGGFRPKEEPNQATHYRHHRLNVRDPVEPQMPPVCYPITPVGAKRKKVLRPTLDEELSSISMSRMKKKGVHNTKRYSEISHLLTRRKAKVRLINFFTRRQIRKYFDYSTIPESWPEIKPNDKKSVIAGVGNNTKVKMAIKRDSHGSKLVAVKKIYSNENQDARTIRYHHDSSMLELCLQRRAESCAPRVYGIAERLSTKTKCHKMYLIMELVKAPNLEKIYHSLNRQQKFTIAHKLAKKLDSLHRKQIYAGDFKDSNVLVNPESLRVTIIDFGCSQDLRIPIKPNFIADSITHYHAPEIYQACRYHCALKGFPRVCLPCAYPGIDKDQLLLPRKADIYSLGIIIGKMFSEHPTGMWCLRYKDNHLNTLDLFDMLTQKKLVVEGLAPDLQPLVTEMLRADPARRPDLPQVMQELKALVIGRASTLMPMMVGQKISFGLH